MLELEVKNLNKRFGGLHVLKDVTFGIKGAELIGLIDQMEQVKPL